MLTMKVSVYQDFGGRTTEGFKWPVFDKMGVKIGELARLTPALLDALPDFIYSQISEERNIKQDVFFSSRLGGTVSTPESTREWLAKVAGEESIRFFMLYARGTNMPVAHYGIFNVDDITDTPQFGALLRFYPGGVKGFIHYCEIALLAFVFGYLKKNAMSLEIFIDNYNVIRMHERSGFFIDHVWQFRAPLASVEDVAMTMKITRERFYEVNPWAAKYY